MTELLVKIFIKDRDNTENPVVRRKYGYLGSCTGIFMNIVLFVGKLIAGLVSGAVSVMADAFNNLSDAGSSVMSLVGFKIAGMPADSNHPFGHGRMEYISGLVISFIIMLMGFELGKDSVTKIIHPEKIVFSYLTFGILIASVIVKLWMGCFNRKLGSKINSATMKAAAMDSLTDCVATTAVIISVLVSKFAGITIDGYVGILVALFIFYSGFSACRDSVTPLLGTKPDEKFIVGVSQMVMSYENIVGVHDLIVHDYGVGNRIISLHAEVPLTMDFMAAHELIDKIECDLKKKYNCLVTIHMDPVVYGDKETDSVKAMVMEIVSETDATLTIHDFRMTKGENHVNLIFDLVVPFDCKYSEKQISVAVNEKLDSHYSAVINFDKAMV